MTRPNTKTELTRSQQHLEISGCFLKIVAALGNLLHGDAATFGVIAGKMLLIATVVVQFTKLFQRLFPRSKGEGDTRLPKRFATVVCRSKCPFAKKAKLLGATLDPLRPIEAEVKSVEESLLSFTRIARKKKLDGFVIELTNPQHIADLDAFCGAFNSVLRTLAADDPTHTDCFAGDVFAPKWQFSFNGMRFFITTFAPFYEMNHPRWSHSEEAAFIYFQPEFSFDHHGIHSGNAHRKNLKDAIRRDFISAGYHLDVALVEQPHEALKYIKPLTVGAKPIRWWDSDILHP
jgi:hypothetical protein